MMNAISLVERGMLPDFITCVGIRRLLKARLEEEVARYTDDAFKLKFVRQMSESPLALNTADANRQHYEVPASFFELVLGKHLKYSCALFDSADTSLSQAEEAMLRLSCERAQLVDGQEILELGCGWGSLSLWMAAKYPASSIVSVSNSASQKDFIDRQAEARGLTNLQVITCDMCDFSIDRQFDRVVSIEMFEHMRNYALLFERIAGWLREDGKLFFHIFCHSHLPYPYEVRSESDWMAENFFTGGLMPSFDLPLFFQDHLRVEEQWVINGEHYARTCDAWLENLDQQRDAVRTALASSGDPTPLTVQLNRWRMFMLACRELFAYRGGVEWHVGHYLLSKTSH